MSKFIDFLKANVRVILIIIVVLIIVAIIILALTIPRKVEQDAVCSNRLSRCNTYDPPFINISQKELPEFYNNEFYEMPKFPYALRDFFIACSYKSYLPCGYTNDLVSYQSISNAINWGARAINLDIFYLGKMEFDPKARIVVGNVKRVKLLDKNGNPRKDINGKEIYIPELQRLKRCSNEDYYRYYLEFLDCLNLIKNIAWLKTNTPLILYLNLEFEFNEGLEYQIYSQIFNVLSDKLLDKYYGFQRVKLGAMPYSKAKNKLIIVTNRKPKNAFLDEITNAVMSSESTGIKLYTISATEAELYGPKSQMGGDDAKKNIIENTSQNLVAVIKNLESNDNNAFTPKIDVFNYNTDFNFDVGVSMTFMNWQKWPEEYMKKYLARFKEGGMILKPLTLRYIPKPPPDDYARNKTLDYTNIEVYGLRGFMDFNV